MSARRSFCGITKDRALRRLRRRSGRTNQRGQAQRVSRGAEIAALVSAGLGSDTMNHLSEEEMVEAYYGVEFPAFNRMRRVPGVF